MESDRAVLPGRLAAALLLTATVLVIYRGAYWRPFDDTRQESLASFHAYGFAAANGAGLWPNPIVARDIDIRHSRIKPYPHWPNGFFLLFEGVLRIFGRTETVGRSLAILLTLTGLTLVVVSLGRQDWLLYATLPLIVMSAMGRDAIPFVFIDAALCFWVGALLWFSGRPLAGRHSHWIFRTAIAAALLCNQLVAPYCAVIVLLKWRESRSARDLALDLGMLAGSTAAVMLALAAGLGNLRQGLEELNKIYAVRSSLPLEHLYRALSLDLRHSLNLEPLTNYLVAGAWVVVLASGQWRAAALLPSFVLFAALLKNYVALHHFARLPLVFFSLITLAVAVEVILDRLKQVRVWGPGLHAARLLIAVILALRLGASKPQYTTDHAVQLTRNSLMHVTSNPETAKQLESCNAFEFRLKTGHTEYQYDPQDRIGQYFFGRQVVERVTRNGPIRSCMVDLATETVEVLSTNH